MGVHLGILKLLMPHDDIDSILKAKGSLIGQGDQVQRLARCGQIGRELFSDLMSEVEANKFAKDVQDSIAALAATTCTAEDIDACKTALMAKASEIAKLTSGVQRRESPVLFLKAHMPMVLADLDDDWMTNLAAFLKGRLLEQVADFPRRPWEEWILQKPIAGAVQASWDGYPLGPQFAHSCCLV